MMRRSIPQRGRQRRGVLLLIVLSLLVLFLLVGLSFMVSASQFNRLAKTAARTETTGMPGHKLADSVMYQLLRGTKNPYSSIQGHSLLEDLYGRDYMVAEVTTIVDVPLASNINNQVQEIRFNRSNVVFGDPHLAAPERQESKDDYYAGCVLTFLNGNAKGRSTRVLEYKTSGSIPFVRIAGVGIVNKKTGIALAPVAPAGERIRFIINGRPFNGTGAGFNPTSGRLDNDSSEFASVPLAFLTNYKAYSQLPVTPNNSAINSGGLDESYDSVDYQNMFLGKIASTGLMKAAVEESDTGDPNKDRLLRYLRSTGGATPSFHRPYLLQHLSSHAQYDNLKHAISMRPSQLHHPSFTGGNPSYTEVFGPWDVDNDGDGVPDSIWMDAGLSPVSAPDGRLYKPLVAIYVLDMDGRTNLNAAGSLEQAFAIDSTTPIDTTGVGVVDQTILVSTGTQRAFGTGYGPADISVSTAPLNLVRNRYLGNERNPGDFKQKENLGPRTSAFLPFSAQSVPGRSWGDQSTNPASNGFPSNDDGINNLIYEFKAPSEFDKASSLQTWVGTPTDYHARGIPLLDATGNIIWVGNGTSNRLGFYDKLDDPYEFNLLNPTTYDSPFDLNELLAINRVAGTTKNRLTSLLPQQLNFFSFEANQYTTHSFSIPAPPTINAGRSRALANGGLRRSLREMFAAKIQRVRNIQQTQDPEGVKQAFIDAGLLMAPEFARGEKLDLNRVLRPNEVPPAGGPPADHIQREETLLNEKATFARYLFNLMALFSDINLSNPNATEQEQVRRLAQWSINVVDFGDADSVMTRMEYDPNPFDTNPATETVWGMEHPELLLTESLAFHDRLLEDLEDPGGSEADGDDDDLDSIDEPEGSLFIELYCPRAKKPAGFNRHASRGPEDIYGIDVSNPNKQQLELSRVDANGRPIWRLGITDVTDTNEPDSPHEELFDGRRFTQFDPSRLDPTSNDGKIPLERFIYFTNSLPPAAGPGTADPKSTFYRNNGSQQLMIDPSSYLVLAPQVLTDVDNQKIDLANRYQLDPTRPGQYTDPMLGRAVIMESSDGNGCNVSEPEGGYDGPEFTSPSDEPFDSIADLSHFEVDDNDKIENYRTIVLQRLANPNLPWDALRNPYLTLDWIPVDLTVFNSALPSGDPANPLEVTSRERTGRVPQGGQAGQGGQPGPQQLGMQPGDPAFNIWSAWSDSDRISNGKLTESLGLLNESMGVPGTQAGTTLRPTLRTAGVYAGAPAPNNHLVDGIVPTLSSLVWHNRPYANPYELLLVPATSSARLTAEYTLPNDESPYSMQSRRLGRQNGRFRHLLNFFESSTGAPKDNQPALNAFRIFDFVTVASPFIGTKKWLTSTDPRYRYISEFREPGKVNLNTAGRGTMNRVGFDSLLSDDATRRVNQYAFEESLHGYLLPTVVSDDVAGYYPDGNHPAEIPNPVRAAVASDLMGRTTAPPIAVDATVLRTKRQLPPGSPQTAGDHPQPALAPFQKPVTAGNVEPKHLALQNPRRNAYFYYRDLIKLGNSITSQSNVYAVWITVGYFEIEPNYDPSQTKPYFVDAFHPDGYRYGIEMGSDVGEIVRDRSFYIIDRSIPVAFEPGVNHNVDQAVLLRRQLE